MISTLLLWLIIGIGLHLCIRSINKAILKSSDGRTHLSHGYLQGYLVGITNLKMYYYIIGSMPSTHWLDDNKFKVLKDRVSLLKTVPEDIKRGAGILDE